MIARNKINKNYYLEFSVFKAFVKRKRNMEVTDFSEAELSKDDIKNICDEAGCDTDQVLAILVELNFISIKYESQIVHFKGKQIS